MSDLTGIRGGCRDTFGNVLEIGTADLPAATPTTTDPLEISLDNAATQIFLSSSAAFEYVIHDQGDKTGAKTKMNASNPRDTFVFHGAGTKWMGLAGTKDKSLYVRAHSATGTTTDGISWEISEEH